MKKYLVVGSKGFIGTWVSNYFSQQEGIKVYGCDVVVDYEAENYFLIDASNASFEKLFAENDFYCCINCSGAASVPASIQNPARDFELNTHNVFKLLTAIKNHNKSCKFVNMSSAAVYGNPETLPIVENQKLGPVSPYGTHKMMAELICKEFSDYYDVQTVALRIFSAYGEGLKKQLFWDLHKKVDNEEAISLWGTGNESRDFIHVEDLIQIIELVLANADFNGETINAANGKEIFIKDAVSTYYSNFENQVDFGFSGNGRKGDPSNWVADIHVIEEFGYKQSVAFSDGLYRYHKWVEERKSK